MHPLIQKYIEFEINGKYPQPPEDYIPQNEIDKTVIAIWWLINDVTKKKSINI
jgi:hypothetical protein